ncbi:MAG: peptidoglycan editing factor PgeF [Gammaproteobacteria bacterium]|nr:peptidoglycan editing factor PgeF [Gammaproteobacteria bacterium]
MTPDWWIKANWPAPDGISAGTTLRQGGTSQPPYDSMNLATHVGDDAQLVQANRDRLIQQLSLPSSPVWLNQQHTTHVINASKAYDQSPTDASYTDQSDVVCAVLTADCVPVLLCDQTGQQIAAIHAGWRGLLNGIIENTIATFPQTTLMAWLGPAISQQSFEVGAEVREQFIQHNQNAEAAFIQGSHGKWHADVYHLAKQRLNTSGVNAVYGGQFCTYSDSERFYSYRRQFKTGRLASLIWKS